MNLSHDFFDLLFDVTAQIELETVGKKLTNNNIRLFYGLRQI